MSRRPNPDRILEARRAAAIARLISEGHGTARAAELVRAWEARLDHNPPTREDWERFGRGPPRPNRQPGVSSRRAPRSASCRPCR